MKKVFYLSILFLSIQNLCAQNIIDFFYSIPSEYVDSLCYVERKSLIKNKRLEKYDMLYTVEYDIKNGYLRLEQSYPDGPSGYGIYEIAYWNVKNKKLIALSSILGSNGGFHQHNFKFFEYKDENLTEARNGYLKSYTSNFEVFINNLVTEFTKKNTSQSVKEDLSSTQFTIELPRKGKNISVSFKDNNMSDPDYFNKNYAKHLNFREKVYKWNEIKEVFE
ncbi:hypothetical protein [Flavobacterium sp. AJR]|uniref:hypothetical protein n=1 Tax=Flavobacterium sp. AJR TaxID=1979369 RepID=UPI000A3D85E9|nr:hypothetical protein [Flavobacterium sp. AJR]OUL61171.1 hypothetical protein B8T70_16745 [Flavobacterium sp. AJR]